MALQDVGLVADGALLIRDGRIVDAGPARRVENLAAARQAEELDASGRVVMPGFVDCHTHLVCGPPRLADYEMRLAGASYHDIAAAGGGILWSVKAVRATSSRRLLHQARQSVAWFVRHGTTTIEAKTGYGLDRTGEMKTLRVLAALQGQPLDIVPTYLGAHAVPPEFEGRAEDYIDWMCAEMLPRIRRRRLARFVDVYCDRGAFSLDEARRYLEAARRMGFALKVHAEQFSRTGAARLAVELGAMSADHLEQVDASDIAALAQSRTVAVLLPGSVFHLGLDRYAPARALIDQGAAVALATDFNPGTSPTCSMPMVIALACAHMRMSPAEAIAAATINAACAIGSADQVGSLEPGKAADLIILDVPDYREIPYHFGVNLVALTMKRGQILYRQGEIHWPENS
ncbi:MAG: imidazolonepropionase [Bryobacterales bacterium]|nr:imidazolonepropionase [Bryobacteraceae bacterium]MDW8354096.1 imidazolonepropionase [Bryobacterales bacterium]